MSRYVHGKRIGVTATPITQQLSSAARGTGPPLRPSEEVLRSMHQARLDIDAQRFGGPRAQCTRRPPMRHYPSGPGPDVNLNVQNWMPRTVVGGRVA